MPAAKTASKPQLWSLMSLVVVKPLAFELIFPFINQFLLEIGVIQNPADAGYYGGLAEGAFAVAQLMTIFPAAWMSDIYGRKPVLIIGSAGIAISMGLFGFSTKYWMILTFRIIGGLVSGSRSSFRVMGSEMAQSRDEESWILTLMSIAGRVGQVIGQPIGGLLSHPEKRWPKLFDYPFWRTYPYALPCLVGAAYALTATLIGLIVLKETLASKRGKETELQNEDGVAEAPFASEETPLLANSESSPHFAVNSNTSMNANVTIQTTMTTPPPSSFLSTLTWPLISVLLSAAGMAFITEIFFAIYPLFCFTPIELGGLGLSEAQIGIQMSVRAVFFIGSLFLYTPSWKRIGRINAYRICLMMWMLTIALFPTLNWIARGYAGGEDGPFWYVCLLFLFVVWAITGWSWPSTYLLISEHTQDPRWSATVQACLQVVVVMSQALGPSIGGALFAFSVKHKNIMGGYLFWVLTFIFALLLSIHSFTLYETSEKTNFTSSPVAESA